MIRVQGSEGCSGDLMELTLAQQSYAFACSIVLGALLGAIYGVLRLAVFAFKMSKVLVFALDFVYMTFSAVLIYLFALAFLSGQIRLFLLPGIVGGFVLYRLTAGRLLGRLFRPVIKAIQRLIQAISKKFKIIAKKVLKKHRCL
ncbi:MAG TPA: hypothetical protein DEO32_01920 [Ruminococcaceae bacterium]|nr:hypothetical protein [Oscillospiraceae bacterium]